MKLAIAHIKSPKNKTDKGMEIIRRFLYLTIRYSILRRNRKNAPIKIIPIASAGPAIK
ncbi:MULTISPECIES: hypothetical protein [Niastella]|uniref:Uncharacterized protein n=1 Tax=Niastella soli TaxID=2821487 RepID=A0ABS3Z628_9BACT|nr:hypothetical protein [Niastella soli]MBO9205135.1 hypothetical protein [Niastella soli]